MIQELVDNNYIFVPKFLKENDCLNLTREFKNFCDQSNIVGDMQAPNSSSVYNFLPFVEVLTQSVPAVCNLIKESVFPTYCYARIYRAGDDLKRHKDRPACEISMTVNLYQKKDWPIYIKTPKGEERKVSFECGDAMLYLGCQAEHWREEINQEEVVQLFLHFVRSRGENNWALFDYGQNDNKLNNAIVGQNKPKPITNKKMGWFL